MSIFIDLTDDKEDHQQKSESKMPCLLKQFFHHAKSIQQQAIWRRARFSRPQKINPFLSEIRIFFYSSNSHLNLVHQIQIFSNTPQKIFFRIQSDIILQKGPQSLEYLDCYIYQIDQMIKNMNGSEMLQNLRVKIYYLKGVYKIVSDWLYGLASNFPSIKKIVKQIFYRVQNVHEIKEKIKNNLQSIIQTNKKSKPYQQKLKQLKNIQQQNHYLKVASDMGITQTNIQKNPIARANIGSNIIKSKAQLQKELQKERNRQEYDRNSEKICNGIIIRNKEQSQSNWIELKRSEYSILKTVQLIYTVIPTIIEKRPVMRGDKAEKRKIVFPQGKNIRKKICIKESSQKAKKSSQKLKKTQQKPISILGLENQMLTVSRLANGKNMFVAKYYQEAQNQEKQEKQEKLYMDYHQLNLAQFLSMNQSRLKFIDILLIIEQIFEACSFIKQDSIIHGDLKLQNFMVLEELCIQMIDFGSSSQPIYPDDCVNTYRNRQFIKRMFSTYYRHFQDIDYKLKEKYKRKSYNYYRHIKFDMFSIGEMVRKLYYDYIIKLNILGHNMNIVQVFRQMLIKLQMDDMDLRMQWEQGLELVQQLKSLIGFQQSEM